MTISGGTLTATGNMLEMGVGSATGSTTLYISGGTVSFRDSDTRVGRALGAGQTGTATLNMTGGTYLGKDLYIPFIPTYSANGRVELYGGTVDVNTITMDTGGVMDNKTILSSLCRFFWLVAVIVSLVWRGIPIASL